MTLIDVFQLRKAIDREEFDHNLLSSILSSYVGVRQKIHELMRAGVIVRVKKGLYVFGANYNRVPVCKETLANLIYGPSCISLEYALAFHGLIPERVNVLTSVTPNKNKEFNTPLGQFTYRYLAQEKYSIGIEQVMVDEQHPVLMASIEKALCDYIVLHKVRHINNPASAEEFMKNDLRIDVQNLSRFRLSELSRINKVYKSTVINHIIEALKNSDVGKK
jgi:predicted transcriptional regulator of viral defense system